MPKFDLADDPLEHATKCWNCGAIASVSADGELRTKCDVCGAPRIELGSEGTLSGSEKRPLKKAREAQSSRAKWRVAGLVGAALGSFGLVAELLVLLAAGVGAGWVTAVAMTVPWLILAVLGASKARSRTADMQDAIAAAWRSAARDVVAAHPQGISARQLEAKLGLDEEVVEGLVAELSLENGIRSTVRDDGSLALIPLTGLRIDAETAEGSVVDPLEERFAELEESMADAEGAPARMKVGG